MRSLRDSTILFVSGHSGPTLSRIERRCLPLMEALVAEGVTVLLVAMPHGAIVRPARAAGVTIAPYKVDRFNVLITRNRLRAYLKRYAPQVALGIGYYADIPLRLAARTLPVKVVSVTHCGAWPMRGFGAINTAFREWVDRRTRDRADAFVVDCREPADAMAADGISAERIHIIPPGTDMARVSREAAIVVDLPAARPLVGYAGALEHSRGLGTLAAAVPLLRERYPSVHVVVGGDGPAKIALLPAALDGRVTLLGRVPSIPAVLSALDVCVFSASEPGIPGSLLEAAALGCPIVASDVPGIHGLFADGKEVVLVPPGDPAATAEAIAALLADPDRAQALGEAARLRVTDNYTSAIEVKRWRTLLRTLGA